MAHAPPGLGGATRLSIDLGVFVVDFLFRVQQPLGFLGEDASVKPIVEVRRPEMASPCRRADPPWDRHFLRQDRLGVIERLTGLPGEPWGTRSPPLAIDRDVRGLSLGNVAHGRN